MGSELLCKRGCYGSTELSIVVPSDAGANFFCNRPRCFRKSPAPRSALRPKRVTLRATQGFAPTGVRELIHQEVGPNGKIKRGQIKLTESPGHRGKIKSFCRVRFRQNADSVSVDAKKVIRLQASGRSWRAIARSLGVACTTARRAALRAKTVSKLIPEHGADTNPQIAANASTQTLSGARLCKRSRLNSRLKLRQRSLSGWSDWAG